MIYALAALFVIIVACTLVPGGMRWLALLVPHLVVKAAAWSLAYIAVKWFTSADGRALRWPLRWMMTRDADLSGDSYWKIECAAKSIDPMSLAARVAWLRRNGGHTANYGLFGADISQAWVDQYRNPVTHWITGGPLWTSDDAFELWISICGIDFMAGWNLIGHQNGRAKYWAQIRRSNPLNP